jgi:hypothetical protein
MNRLKQLNESYVHAFCSLQFNYDEGLSNLVKQFCQFVIPDKYVYDKEGYGRDSNIHTTILYGIETPLSPLQRLYLNNYPSFQVELGQISFFNNDEFDVMKIEVKSESLVKLNNELKYKVDYQNHYPKYEPHCTICYLKKNTYHKLNFMENYFYGKPFTVNTVEFVSRDGSRELLRLKG